MTVEPWICVRLNPCSFLPVTVQMVAKPPTMINTRAMFMSDNPQKIYSVNNPLDTTYALPPPNPYGTRNAQGSVRFVGALQPAGQTLVTISGSRALICSLKQYTQVSLKC
jgi:hypothetical protein